MLIRNASVLVQSNNILMHRQSCESRHWWAARSFLSPLLVEPATVGSPNFLKAEFSAWLLRAGIHSLQVNKDTLLLAIRRVLSHLVLRGSYCNMGFGKLSPVLGLISYRKDQNN